jgi:spore germination protein
MKKVALLFLLAFLLLTGCAQPRILEEIGLITAIGYDVGEDGKIEGTAVELKIDPEAKTDIRIVKSTAYSLRGLNTNANRKTSKRLLAGQLRVLVLGNDMVNRGIIHISETLAKDPSISDLTYMVIAEGEARDLLSLKDEAIPDIGIHLFRLIEQNTNDELMPSATLQEVLHRYYTKGRDPFIPILKKGDKEIIFTGVGIFNEDRLVGRLSPNQSFYLKLINDKYRAGSLELRFKTDSPKLKGHGPPEENTVIALDTINSDSEIKLVSKKNLVFDLKIKLNARLLEINSPIDLAVAKNIKLFEKEVEKQLTKEVEKLIEYCQLKNSDVFGLGEVYRSSVRHSKLTKDKWHSMYPNAKVNVTVDFQMMRSGIYN